MTERRVMSMVVRFTVECEEDLETDEVVDLVQSNLQVGLFQDGDEMPVTDLTISQVKVKAAKERR